LLSRPSVHDLRRVDGIGVAPDAREHDTRVYYNLALEDGAGLRGKQGNVPNLRNSRRVLLVVVAGIVIAYCAGGAYLWWAMHQPPETFARAVAGMPQPVVFLLYPFETLWTHARTGSLKLGDRAPDFSLLKVDKSERIQLSALNAHKSVVLVFGSYT